MLEDSEDMIIPDDMQRFLNERYHNTQSQPTSEDMQVSECEGWGWGLGWSVGWGKSVGWVGVLLEGVGQEEERGGVGRSVGWRSIAGVGMFGGSVVGRAMLISEALWGRSV